MGADEPIPDGEQAASQEDQAIDQPTSDTTDRAAAMGADPSPLLGVVSDLLRRYADALERAPRHRTLTSRAPR